ncbi:Type VI secretion system tube protein Hcp [Sulfidibacter corallicola]|uniref:Type VI secretion system tube protein Hcp n=1 Tax=Sulfidibacter corallicola TaxID=2818388 RepID=A0A8A4TPG6_SULCO|nr:type VI secretion system tube protein Hcp [Sulfidibacter corallicola]QTD50972.1 type VI secretion system tube protein Hcp [Sulfidibacter corallicola]
MFNIFMTLQGIEGDTLTKGYEKHVGVSSFSHGLSMNAFCIPGKEGRTQGYVHHNDVSISKVMDNTSVKIQEKCCQADPIPEVTIKICREKGSNLIPIITYTLHDVLISSYSVSAGAGGNPMENLTLNYSTIKWEYKDQRETGLPQGQMAAGWDIRENKSAA